MNDSNKIEIFTYHGFVFKCIKDAELPMPKFINEEWPAMITRIRQLGLDINELIQSVTEKQGES